MKTNTAILAGFMGISATSCLAGVGDGEPNEDVSVVTDTLEDSNALNLNALNLNALNLNALNLNALNLNALSASALTTLRRPDSEGELARLFLKYTASCALSESQFIEIDWIDSQSNPHLEVYWGLMALAPTWSTTGLSAEGARWISACLASRVNWYEFPVQISSRGPHGMLNTPSAGEVAGYPKMEGAFWGNLFTGTPELFACHEPLNIDHSREKKRDCAAGHVNGADVVDCGIIHIVGACGSRCAPDAGGGTYFESCNPAPMEPNQAEVITVWLPL